MKIIKFGGHILKVDQSQHFLTLFSSTGGGGRNPPQPPSEFKTVILMHKTPLNVLASGATFGAHFCWGVPPRSPGIRRVSKDFVVEIFESTLDKSWAYLQASNGQKSNINDNSHSDNKVQSCRFLMTNLHNKSLNNLKNATKYCQFLVFKSIFCHKILIQFKLMCDFKL